MADLPARGTRNRDTTGYAARYEKEDKFRVKTMRSSFGSQVGLVFILRVSSGRVFILSGALFYPPWTYDYSA
jgi:hypothetical protein